MSTLQTAMAFVRKDCLEELSYRFRLLFAIGAGLVSLGFLAIFSDFVGKTFDTKLEGLEGGLMAFWLLGVTLHNLLETALRELSGRVRMAQTMGTLEALLATRTSLVNLMICLPLYPLLRTTFKLLCFLLLGYLFLKVPIQWGNWPAALLVLLLSLLVFGCLGLSFAGLTVVFKRTEPVIRAFSIVSFLLGGVLVPVSKLPESLQGVSPFLPISPAVQGFRQALVGEEFPTNAILHLCLYAALLLPVSLVTFRWAVRRAMRDGSLTQY